jgi:polysaccharide deacetylase family protein (PEP-CTERM system associated)
MTTSHHFTVDVEEYFHPTAMAPYFPMSEWEGLERRSPATMERLLSFLAQRDVVGTFFVVGWLAEREPEMVRAIAAEGHEVASHGYEHELVGKLGPEGFRASVGRSKKILEDTAGQRVRGYRAPSFSIVPGLEWAFDVLLEEGYQYDASLFPVSQHPTYGYPSAESDPFPVQRASGSLFELPATTARIGGARLPASGGAYFRLLPYGLVRRGLRQAAARGRTGMFYIHPWELDQWTPDVAASWLQRTRTFAGRGRIWKKMDRLFREFSFGPIRDSLADADE